MDTNTNNNQPPTTTNQILSAIDAIQPEAIDFLHSIISIDSTLEKGEGNVQSLIYEHLQKLFGPIASPSGPSDDKVHGPPGISHHPFQVDRIPVTLNHIQSQPGFSPVDWSYTPDQKFNVVARYTYHDTTSTDHYPHGSHPHLHQPHPTPPHDDPYNRPLLLQGHVDVVPADESDGWTSPPFTPVIRNNAGEILSVPQSLLHQDARMYGRGAGDMKAGIVAMIYALFAWRRLGYLPRASVTIATVIEEECTGNGALAIPLQSLLSKHTCTTTGTCTSPSAGTSASLSTSTTTSPDPPQTKIAVLIPEPFPFLVTAQLGVLWIRVAVLGRPCHVLDTAAGSNAIHGAFALYAALQRLEQQYNRPSDTNHHDLHPAYRGIDHPVNFNLGRIQGGNWPSSVPSSCWFDVRVGFFPGITVDTVKADVERVLYQEAAHLGIRVQITYRGFHADGAVLLSEYIDGAHQPHNLDPNQKSLQTEFVELIQKCHKIVIASSSPSPTLESLENIPDLPLKPVTCTTDARFYSSLYHDPNQVVVTCYGPEAANIHGVDESVSLKSLRDVTCTIALFIRDWCGLIQEHHD